MISLIRLIVPMVFVLLWSTGFIMARLGMKVADPASYLFLFGVGVVNGRFLKLAIVRLE